MSNGNEHGSAGSIALGQRVNGGAVGLRDGLRERKKRATRQALHSAALRLVAERGFDAVTIEDIAAAADVSPRTFFNYFESKEAVIVHPDPEAVGRLRERLARNPHGGSPLDALRVALREQASEFTERREEWLLRLRLVRDIPALTPRYLGGFVAFERVLAEDVARRTGTSADHDLYPALVAGAAMTALRVSVLRWRDDGGTSSLPKLVDSAFASLSAGLAPASSLVHGRHSAG